MKDAKRKRQARLERVAKEKGIAAVYLSRAITGRMTKTEDRPAEPEAVGVEDPQRQVVLSYAWVVDQYGRGNNQEGMAKLAGVTSIEMQKVLDDYDLPDSVDSHRRCGARRRG